MAGGDNGPSRSAIAMVLSASVFASFAAPAGEARGWQPSGAAAEDPVKRAEAAAAKAAADKAAAEKALAAAVAAEKAAAEQMAAAQESAKISAVKAAALKEATARVAARRTALERAIADVAANDAARKGEFTDRAVREKVARDEGAIEKAKADLADAQKVLEDKKSATESARGATQAALDASKTAPDDTAKGRAAETARTAQDRAERDQANAVTAARSIDVSLRALTTELAAGKDVLALIDKVEAAKNGGPALDADAARRANQTIDAFKTAALTQAIDLERAAHEKAVADRTAAERLLPQRAAAVETARGKLGAAKAAAEILAADAPADKRSAAEQAVAAATAAVESAAAEERATREELEKIGPRIRESLARYHETLALVQSGLPLLPADQWDYAKARHLLVRAGFGGSSDEIERLHAMGLHAAVEYLVDYDRIEALDLPFHAVLPEPAIPNENRLASMRQREMTDRRRNADTRQQAALRDWWIERMVRTPRPLEEKLVLFWHGHFATEYQTVRDSYALAMQNDLLREHAVTSFAALLHGIVQDPAMLRYLDNNSNVKGRPNENLAREIMELFAMGEGNYTENDIMEGARALTGYTYDPATRQFRFVVSRHDTENKTIFGRTGDFAGDDFVDLILQQPFTAPFIAGKVFGFFAHDAPSEETVTRLAGVLRTHQYDLRPMLKNLFMSREFYSESAVATQIKSPVQLVVGTLRDLGIRDVAYGPLSAGMTAMGQELYGPPNVKGWEGGEYWVNANRVFVRYNGIADLIDNIAVPNQPRGLDLVGALEGRVLNSPEEVVDYLARSCLAVPLPDEKRKILIDRLGGLPPSADWSGQRAQVNARLRTILVLMMSMPEFQCT